MNATLTINHTTYNVIAAEPVNASFHPNRAKNIIGTIFMQKGSKGNLYSVSVRIDGTINEKHIENLGKWTEAQIDGLISQAAIS